MLARRACSLSAGLLLCLTLGAGIAFGQVMDLPASRSNLPFTIYPNSVCLNAANRDACLVRISSDILAQQRGATAQQYRIYGATDRWTGLATNSTGTFTILMAEAAPGAMAAPALAGAGAGNVDNGLHSYKVTFVTATGETEAGTASAQITVADKTVNGKVSLAGIPMGTSGIVTSRKLYRTVAGDTGSYLLLATLADNTTTTYTDNTADSGLGAAAPAANSTADARVTIGNAGSVTLASGQLLIPNGTAAAPALALSSDPTTGLFRRTATVLGLSSGGTQIVDFNGGVSLQDVGLISWNFNNTIDLRLARDAANILAQRNGTNAQEQRWYETFTDASNYSRVALVTSASGYDLLGQAAGTGTLRNLRTNAGAGTGRQTFLGPINVQTSAAGIGNLADATDDILFTYTLPLNSLSSNGKSLRVRAWGKTAANANNKTIKLWFAGTAVVSSGAIAINNLDWHAEMELTLVDATHVSAVGTYENGAFANGVTTVTPYLAVANLTLNAVEIKVTGASALSAANDVLGHGMKVWFEN